MFRYALYTSEYRLTNNSDNDFTHTVMLMRPTTITAMVKVITVTLFYLEKVTGKPSVFMEDNLSTIEMIKGNINHKTGKHISPKFNYTKQHVVFGYLKVIHCPSKDMITDLLTKPLYWAQHNNLSQVILHLPSF